MLTNRLVNNTILHAVFVIDHLGIYSNQYVSNMITRVVFVSDHLGTNKLVSNTITHVASVTKNIVCCSKGSCCYQ